MGYFKRNGVDHKPDWLASWAKTIMLIQLQPGFG